MINELLEFAVKAGRESKVQSIKRAEKMMSPTFVVYRGDRQVAIVVAGTEGRRDVLSAARACIIGLAADVLVMSIDTFTAKVMKNPMTGQDWESGEMQLVVDKHHGIERGWVADAVHVMAINRADDLVAETLPYRKVSRHRVEFLDPQQWKREAAEANGAADLSAESPKMGGVIPDRLREYMAEPVLTVTMQQEAGLTGADFGLSPEQARAHEDLVIARMLNSHGCTVLLSSDAGTERAQVLDNARDGEKL